MSHRIGIGHIPAAGAVSWGCTCGRGDVLTYAPCTPPEYALRLIAGRAARHTTDPRSTS